MLTAIQFNSLSFQEIMAQRRPNYPQIYSEFKLKLPNDDTFTEFIIQDLTEEFFDESVKFIIDNRAEAIIIHDATGTLLTEEGRVKVERGYRKALEEKISLICLIKGSKTLVGLNALCISTRDDFLMPKEHLNKSFRMQSEASIYILNAVNVFDVYGVEKFVSGSGLCVDSKYRRCGIAKELLKARKSLMKSIDVSLTSTMFTTHGAQQAAKSVGFDENFSIDYESLEKLVPGSNFSHAYGKFCKIMSLKI